MSTIAVDIDSTLYDFDTIAREACLKLWQETGDDKYREGMYFPNDHWRAPADVLGVERWLRAIALCHDDEMILKQVPFAGAVETCQALIEAGHQLIFISNRKTETEEATFCWLRDCGFLRAWPSRKEEDKPARLVVTEGDKKPFIKDCQYLIDDRLKTCVEFVYDYDWQYKERGLNRRKAFLLQYNYNQNATDIPGLYVAPTWAGLNVYLERKGVLPKAAYKALA